MRGRGLGHGLFGKRKVKHEVDLGLARGLVDDDQVLAVITSRAGKLQEASLALGYVVEGRGVPEELDVAQAHHAGRGVGLDAILHVRLAAQLEARPVQLRKAIALGTRRAEGEAEGEVVLRQRHLRLAQRELNWRLQRDFGRRGSGPGLATAGRLAGRRSSCHGLGRTTTRWQAEGETRRRRRGEGWHRPRSRMGRSLVQRFRGCCSNLSRCRRALPALGRGSSRRQQEAGDKREEAAGTSQQLGLELEA
mmetsp:Transcript_1669/g.6667  ORF Transcript_1669/g.6667 Transcript_1669/m.6667 type:complete len:250 (-) Transcript_1669:119-868(-)